MWEINLNLQIEGFLWSMVFGAVFCIAFDIMNISGQQLKASKSAVFAADIVYFTVVSFVTFCLFLVFCSGEIRGFIFVGEIIGFFLCKKTVSKLYTPIMLIVFSLLKRLFLLINRRIFGPVYVFFSKIHKNINKLSLKKLKNSKKA